MRRAALLPILLTGLATTAAAAPCTLDLRIYDATNPGFPYLQPPCEAFAGLPPAPYGNRVDWVAALRRGLIDPRATVDGTGAMEVLDLDVVMTETLNMPPVLFSHRVHTEWHACASCHPAVAIPLRGANEIDMSGLLAGESCGLCHGSVAFPLADCYRCHVRSLAADR